MPAPYDLDSAGMSGGCVLDTSILMVFVCFRVGSWSILTAVQLPNPVGFRPLRPLGRSSGVSTNRCRSDASRKRAALPHPPKRACGAGGGTRSCPFVKFVDNPSCRRFERRARRLRGGRRDVHSPRSLRNLRALCVPSFGSQGETEACGLQPPQALRASSPKGGARNNGDSALNSPPRSHSPSKARPSHRAKPALSRLNLSRLSRETNTKRGHHAKHRAELRIAVDT